MKYLIDANILISGYKKYFPMDVHVSYWKTIKEQIAIGNFVIIDKVKDEIQDEPLVAWMNQNVNKQLYETSTDSMNEYKHIQMWANGNPNFGAVHKEHFAKGNVADPFLVAKALKCGYTVVTYEEAGGRGTTKIKIPDVCEQFGVPCITINDALRELKIKL